MTIRVNDQINIVGLFENDSNNEYIKKVKPISKSLYQSSEKKINPWVISIVKKVFELTHHNDALVITKFPRIGDIKPIPKALIWSQEQGVFNNFGLQEVVETNIKDKDFRGERNSHDDNGRPRSPLKSGRKVPTPRNKSTPHAPTIEEKQARAYLFSDAANERLGNSPLHQKYNVEK